MTIAATTLCLATGFVAATPRDIRAHHEGPDALKFAANAEAGRTYVLTVEGMSCPLGCAPKVEEALGSIEGVESVKVDFENKQAVVHTSAGHEITQKACDDALGNSGYFVETIKELGPDDSGA